MNDAITQNLNAQYERVTVLSDGEVFLGVSQNIDDDTSGLDSISLLSEQEDFTLTENLSDILWWRVTDEYEPNQFSIFGYDTSTNAYLLDVTSSQIGLSSTFR